MLCAQLTSWLALGNEGSGFVIRDVIWEARFRPFARFVALDFVERLVGSGGLGGWRLVSVGVCLSV